MTSTTLEARRAIEAMRSGVPSAAAVRTLGSGQDALERRFRGLLVQADEGYASEKQQCGLVIRAGFGGGKSHLLTCFEHLALSQNFAVSRVVISKETPLHVPAKLLAATTLNLRLPERIGRGLEEVGSSLQGQFGSKAYRHLQEFLTREGGLNSRFAATLQLYQEGSSLDAELGDKVLRFWAGEKLDVSEVKKQLRELGASTTYRLEPIRVRDLALQTMTFLPHLIRAAGYKGLVLLIDELELIGRYTRLARSQAYAELARWMGASDDASRAGLLTIGAITDDFSQHVLVDKQDLDLVESFLAGRDPASVAPAAQGMRLLQQAQLLEAPTPNTLGEAYRTLKTLHACAYNWAPPDVTWPESLRATPMRTYVRAWINGWDVRRLYPDQQLDQAGYQIDPVTSTYVETAEIESQDESD